MNQIIMDYKSQPGKLYYLLKLLILFIFTFSVIAFWQSFFDPFGPAQLMFIRVFIPLFILLYLLISFENKQLILKTSFLLYPLIGYLIISFISIFFALNKEISIKYFIELFLVITGSYFLYLIIDKKFFEKMIIFILIFHTIISIYGILQHFNMDFFKWNTNFAGRPMGTIGNPDFFAGQLLFALSFLFAYLFFGRKNIFFIIISLFIVLLTFIYTKVIGAFIGFLSGILVLFIIILFFYIEVIKKFLKNKLILYGFILLMFVLTVLIYNPAANRIKKILVEKKRSIVHRMLMWEASLLMIYESPVIGKGVGNYRLYYPYYQAKLLNNPINKQYDYVVTWMPHQNYLLIASETGLVGLLMFLIAIFYFYIISWKIIFVKKVKDPVPIGIITGVTAILGASFFNTFYNIPSTTLYFFFFLFILNIYYQENQKIFYIKNNLYFIIILLVAILLVSNIIMDSKTLISNIFLKQANKYVKSKNYNRAIEYYERIIGLKPVELCPQMDVAHFYFAAEAYRETGDFEKAKKYYYEDLKLNPYCPEVNNMLGALLGQLGNIDESIKKLEMAIYVAPHYEAAYINLATAYFVKKDYTAVKRVINKFIELNGETKLFNDMLNQVENLTAPAKKEIK